jgi:hypothetical protein
MLMNVIKDLIYLFIEINNKAEHIYYWDSTLISYSQPCIRLDDNPVDSAVAFFYYLVIIADA